MSKLVLALFAAVVAAGPGFAQTARKTVDVSAASADVTKVLQSIADQANVTIVVEPGVVGSVDVVLRGVSLSSALTSVTKAAYLSWKRLLVPQNYTAADLRSAVNALNAAPSVNIIAAASGSLPATAVLTGSVAEKATGLAASLGLREVYWVYSTETAAPAAAWAQPAVAESETQPEETTQETEQETAASVYRTAGASLSNLDPADAYEVLQRLTDEVLSVMSPQERQAALGGPPILTEPAGYYLGSGISSLRMGNLGGPTVFRRVYRWPW